MLTGTEASIDGFDEKCLTLAASEEQVHATEKYVCVAVRGEKSSSALPHQLLATAVSAIPLTGLTLQTRPSAS